MLVWNATMGLCDKSTTYSLRVDLMAQGEQMLQRNADAEQTTEKRKLAFRKWMTVQWRHG